MTPMRRRQLKLALASVGLLMLITFAAYREIENGITGIHIAFADDQTAIFEEMLEKVERGDIGEAADFQAEMVKSLGRACDAGLFTNPAEIANFNADPDLDALRSELLFVGFRQSVWP
jgi:hypothetical protein